MSQMTGMIIEDVRQLSSQLSSAADEIQTLIGSLTAKIDSTTWVGPDRERFHSDWTGTYVQQLTTVMNGLREASTNAVTNANQQEQASA
jgi:uncharacterized protein YukE